MSARITLGPAVVADAPRIARMSREHVERGLRWSWKATRVARLILHPDCEAVVARREGKLVAFALAEFHPEHVHLVLLAVDPAERRGGLGRRLVAWLEEMAQVAGVFRVDLEVRTSNGAAHAFYQALGYHIRRELDGYYQGKESAIEMRHDLRQKAPAGPKA